MGLDLSLPEAGLSEGKGCTMSAEEFFAVKARLCSLRSGLCCWFCRRHYPEYCRLRLRVSDVVNFRLELVIMPKRDSAWKAQKFQKPITLTFES